MKKLISVVLVITSLLSLLSFGVPVVQAKSYADFSGKYQLLRTVGIIPDIPQDRLEKGVSRADFAIYAANILNVQSGRNDDKRYYTDIPADHWALDSINALVERGALTVPADKLFNPDREITLWEAVKIMLALTGFAPFAEARGGFPTGYMQIAYDRDLTDGIKTAGFFTMKDAITLIFNAVTTPILDSYAFEGETVHYNTTTDTLLSMYHDIYRREDYVNGVYGISLNDMSAPEKNRVRMGNDIYAISGGDTYSFLGMYTEFFFRDNDDAFDEIIYIRPVEQRNEYTDMDLSEINGFNDTDYTISHTDSKNNTSRYKISYGVKVFNNGKNVSDNITGAFTALDTKQGTLRLIDKDRNNVYDIAIISEYTDMVVGHIDTENEIVYDKYDPSVFFSLKEESGKTAMLYTQSGASAQITSLSLGSIVTLFKSDNYTRAFFSDSVVKGNISQVITDDDGTVITIVARFGDSSTDYRLDKKFLARSGVKLSVGVQVSAALDIYGRIAYMDLEDSEMMYGYLINQGKKGTISSTLQFKVLTDDGEVRVLDCAERVLVDGTKEKGSDDIDTAIKKGQTDPKLGQVIRFSLDDEGKVKEIDTIHSGKGGNDKLFVTHDWATRRYSSRSVRFDTTAMAGANTVIFRIPEINDTDNPDVLPDDITLADDDDFMTLKTSFFSNSSSYNMQAYKLKKESGFEDVIVYQGTVTKTISTSTDMFVISSIRYELTDDGDYAESVYGCTAGTMLSYRMAPGFSVKDLGYESGDIIRIVTNNEGEAIDVACVYKYMNGIDPNTNAWITLSEGTTTYSSNFWENGRYKTITTANPWSAFTVAYANVVSTNDGVLKLSRTGYTLDDVDEVLKISTTPVIVIYDKQAGKDKISIGNLSDLVPGVSAGEGAVKVFVRTEESHLRWIVLYK